MTTTTTTRTLGRQALETYYPDMVGYASRTSPQEGGDIASQAAIRFLEALEEGKYDSTPQDGWRLVLLGLTRQTGYHLWRAESTQKKYIRNSLELAPRKVGTDESLVEAKEILALAYAYAPSLGEALVVGDSIAEWGASKGVKATTAKGVAKEAATAAYLYQRGVPVADHQDRVRAVALLG